MISMYTKQEIIIRCYRQGQSQRQIAKELHVSRRTVKKYIEAYEESIIAAVEQFNGLEFDSGFIKRYSERFDVPFFKDKIRSIVFENEN